MEEINIRNAIKLLIPSLRGNYISSLCECYDSVDMLDFLQKMCAKYKILVHFLKKEIAQKQKEVEFLLSPPDIKEISIEEIKEIEEMRKVLQMPNSKCCRCPWGNGEGGCTIPGYCPS